MSIHVDPRSLERKEEGGASAADVAAKVAEVSRAVAEMRQKNDEALAEVKKGFSDVVRADEVKRISEAVGNLEAELISLKRIGLAGGDGEQKSADVVAHTKGYEAFIRKGDEAGLRSLEAKALSVGTDADGGYTAPREWDRTVVDKLKLVSPIRAEASVMSISAGRFSKLFNDRATGSGWVAETAARPATANAQFAPFNYDAMELYAHPTATQTLLDDSELNIEEWLAGEVSLAFAQQEGAAFTTGDGSGKPRGFMTHFTGQSGLHPWGAVADVVSGNASALTGDGIVNLQYSLPSAFQGNAKFYANRATINKVRLLKDGQDLYLWQANYQAGEPATLAGKPIIEVPDMANVAANSRSLAYGDMRQAYLIVDRVGIRTLRDPYSNKPYVSFYTTKRVGGNILNPEAIKYQLTSV